MEATLLTLGVILILVGLIGQVKAKEIEVGTKNPIVRFILGLLGLFFVSTALGMGTGLLPELLAPTPTITPSPTPAIEPPPPTFTPVTPEPAVPTEVPTFPPPPTEVLSPDLIISGFTLDPSTPTQGESVSVRVEVSNRGNGAAGAFTVQWWPGENYQEPACTWPMGSLGAGGVQTLVCTYNGYPSWYASLTTKAVVDANEQVPESDELNNTKGLTISVKQPQPSATRITFDALPNGSPITSDRILNGDEFLSQGIRLEGAPESSYCMNGTAAAIRGPNTYNGLNFWFLTSATPSEVNRCNGIPVAIIFTPPVRQVTLTFAGASTTYTMKIITSGGKLIGKVEKEAVLGAGLFEISFQYGSPDISRVTFGKETAVTAIKEISYEP